MNYEKSNLQKMIYLVGITIANWNNKKIRKFKQLRIPFKSEKELEKYRANLENQMNEGIENPREYKYWVNFMRCYSKKAELFVRLRKVNYICIMNFKKAIEEKGLKQTWIASKIGVSDTTLSYYLTGTRPMPEEIGKKLETILS